LQSHSNYFSIKGFHKFDAAWTYLSPKCINENVFHYLINIVVKSFVKITGLSKRKKNRKKDRTRMA